MQPPVRHHPRVVPVQVRHEVRTHHRPVLVRDARVRHHQRHRPPQVAEQRQVRREQPEPYPPQGVEVQDARQQAERRVVHHHVPIPVREPLEVPAREKGTHRPAPLRQQPAFPHVRQHRLVDGGRGVAVVRRQLRLELLREPHVVLEHLPARPSRLRRARHLVPEQRQLPPAHRPPSFPRRARAGGMSPYRSTMQSSQNLTFV